MDPWWWATVVLSNSLMIAGVLVLIWAARRLAERQLYLRQAYTMYPGSRREIRRQVRHAFGPALERRRRYPVDPAGLRERLAVPPEVDGRPGFEVAVPGPQCRLGPPDPFGIRTATVRLRGGALVLVMSLGAVGSIQHGEPILDAARRAEAVRGQAPPGWTCLGPVERVETGAGTGWRLTALVGGGRQMFADTHVDRGGWAYVIGVVAPPAQHAEVARLADAMLATWRWIDVPPSSLRTPWSGPPARS